jgi:hypothetical protein
MAAITPTGKVKKIPLGHGWLVMGTVVPSGILQAADYVSKDKLGLTRIISAQVQLGFANGASRCCMQLNARGTGVAEGTNLGDLGFQVLGSAAQTINFIVYGEGRREVP